MDRTDLNDDTPDIKLRFCAGAALGLLVAMLMVWLNSLQGPVILLATILGCMFLFGYLAVCASEKIWGWLCTLLN